MQGQIIKISSNRHVVNSNGINYNTIPRGKFRKDKLIPKVGDYVRFNDKTLVIEEILPRKNTFNRPMVSNIDRAFIITSLVNPDFSLGLLDKFIAHMELNNVDVVICLTKTDLIKEQTYEKIKELMVYYTNIGYKVITNKALDQIKNLIKDNTNVFIGQTGAGKSTLLNLIPRFYDATEGEVLVDGVNGKDYKQEDLHNILGYVPQKAVLFKGAIKSNVAYGENGKKITDKKIEEAIHVAQADDFVLKLDDKYEHAIAQGGTNVSGGQKQRLSIARAIARNPEIYLFDDSFSALDYKTDATLRKELKKYTKDATTLIVAQRIGTVMNADKILVLENGECVGMGTHKELLKDCEVYKQIALSQLSKEELENA